MPARPAHHPLATLPERGLHPHLPPRWIRRRGAVGQSDEAVGPWPDPVAHGGDADSRGQRPGPDRDDRDGASERSARGGRPRVDLRSQDGSVATEYGLLAVVAATIVSVMLDWATSGGITSLLQSIMARVSSLVGL